MLNLDFQLKPSRLYFSLHLITMLISIALVLYLPILWLLKLILLSILIGYGTYLICHYGLLRHPDSITQIRRLSDGCWLLHTSRKIYEARLCNFSTATCFVSILRFYPSGHRWPTSCIIFPDSLNQDLYRQLLVVLRMF